MGKCVQTFDWYSIYIKNTPEVYRTSGLVFTLKLSTFPHGEHEDDTSG